MCAAAEFDGAGAPLVVGWVVHDCVDCCADGDDSDGVWVGFAEDCAEAGDFSGFAQRDCLCADDEVCADGVCEDAVGLCDLLGCDGLWCVEVEAEFVWGDEAAALVCVCLECLAEREVEEVCCGVVCLYVASAVGVYADDDFVAYSEFAAGDSCDVEDVSTECACVDDCCFASSVEVVLV